jgi:hypothetical protein
MTDPTQNPFRRPCGSCTVCCSALGIEELKKFAGPSCVHLKKPVYGDHHACEIYTRRPTACARFYCAWAFGLGPQSNGRPDRSGLLVVIYPPGENASLQAVITIVDGRQCGDIENPESLLCQFLQQLLESGFKDIKVLNRKTSGVLWLSDNIARVGHLKPNAPGDYEGLLVEVQDNPVGAVLEIPKENIL